MDKDEWKEYLRKINSYSCPIPQYEEMQSRLKNWYAKNSKSKKAKETK